MKFKNILMSCVIIFGSISLSGCYTQLSMFHPDPEIEEEFHSYSVARVRPNLTLYANDGTGTSLGMAYGTMYNRFYGFNNRYSYYNPYYYGGIYNDYVNYNIFDGTYTVWIPGIQEKKKKQRIWTRDNKSTTSKLKVTRTRTNTSNRVSDPYPVQDTPKQDTFNSQRSTSSSNSGTRATRRN